MRELNILLLSVGRRVELVQCFKNAANKLGISSKVIAGDCSNTAPALYFADKFIKLPKISEKNYIEYLIDVCKSENISLLVPTIDTDLLLLAENKQLIEKNTNTKVLISDKEVVRICRDKVLTQKFLEENGFGVPKMYTYDDLKNGKINFPMFIKPRSGSSSKNTFKINNREELELYRNIVEDPIIQDYLDGEEYTVDVFLDFNGKVITIAPRLRIAVRGGEISKGKIVKDWEIIENVRRLMNKLKPIGQVTVQLKKTKNGIEYIEINPRFGGGAPMSIKSGADSCENLYRLLLGQELYYHENYRDNLMFLRYDSSICLDENMEFVNFKEEMELEKV